MKLIELIPLFGEIMEDISNISIAKQVVKNQRAIKQFIKNVESVEEKMARGFRKYMRLVRKLDDKNDQELMQILDSNFNAVNSKWLKILREITPM